jgi:hypothetical protein
MTGTHQCESIAMTGTQQTQCLLKNKCAKTKRKTEHRSLDLSLSKPVESFWSLSNAISSWRPKTHDQPTRQVDAVLQTDCSAHRNQCCVHSLWINQLSFCSCQRACFVTIFQLRRVDKFSLAASGRPQALVCRFSVHATKKLIRV